MATVGACKVAQLITCLPSIGETWTASPTSKIRGSMPSKTVALKRQRQDWKFVVILNYTVGLLKLNTLFSKN